MTRILLSISIFGVLLSQFVNQETGWSYIQETSQAFYFFESIHINGEVILGDGCLGAPNESCEGLEQNCLYCCENPGSCDVVGAFYNDVCVGWVYNQFLIN